MKYIYETTDRKAAAIDLFKQMMLNPKKNYIDDIINNIMERQSEKGQPWKNHFINADTLKERIIAAYQQMNEEEKSKFLSYFSYHYLNKGKKEEIKKEIKKVLLNAMINYIIRKLKQNGV